MNALTTDRLRIRRTGRLGAVLLVLLGLAAGACSSTPANTGSAPGITPTSVLIGSDQPLTGPAALGYSEIGPASRAVFQYVDAHGGVNGRTITYTYVDDGYNAVDSAKAVPVEQQLVNEDHVFACFNAFGLLTHAGIVDSLNTQGVPDVQIQPDRRSLAGCSTPASSPVGIDQPLEHRTSKPSQRAPAQPGRGRE